MILKWLINPIVKALSWILLKIEAGELQKIPMTGPLLLVANHINFLDAPVMISYLHPRPTTGLVKKETWNSPFMAFLFNIWGGIPIDREIADFSAIKSAQQALSDQKILAVLPEGTRTEDGHLVRGKPGVAMLALKADVPILPVAYYGHEGFLSNLKHLRRTPMKIIVGEPFRVHLNGHLKSKDLMQEVADEIMIEIAKLLPEEYRGLYADQIQRQPVYLAPSN